MAAQGPLSAIPPTPLRRGGGPKEEEKQQHHCTEPCHVLPSLAESRGCYSVSLADGSLPTWSGYPQRPNSAVSSVVKSPHVYLSLSCTHTHPHPACKWCLPSSHPQKKPLFLSFFKASYSSSHQCCCLHGPGLHAVNSMIPLTLRGGWLCSCCPHSPMASRSPSSAPYVVFSEPDFFPILGEMTSDFLSQHIALPMLYLPHVKPPSCFPLAATEDP